MKLYVDLATKLPVWLLLFLSASSVVTGDFFAKYWSQNQRGWALALAFIGYFGSGFFYIPTLLREGLVVTSLVWDLLGLLGFLVIGLLVFREHLTSLQIVAAALGVVALILLNLGR